MLVRVPQSTPSWATRKCLCLPHLATPSISRYFCSISFWISFSASCSLWVFLWSSSPLTCWSFLLCAQHKLLTYLSDPLCGTWPLLMWLPRPCDAILRLYQGRDDLQWNPPNWPNERPRPPCVTNILSAFERLVITCILGLHVCLGNCIGCIHDCCWTEKPEILVNDLPKFIRWGSIRTAEVEAHDLMAAVLPDISGRAQALDLSPQLNPDTGVWLFAWPW